MPAALGRLAAELGVEIHLDTSIERILHENGRVVGLRTAAGEEIRLPRSFQIPTPFARIAI